MARRTHSPAAKVFSLVLAIAFGLIALTVSYAAFKGGIELRSKAAQEGVIVKAWEFNGSTTEGWEATGGTVSDGFFRIPPAGVRTLEMIHRNPQATANAGAKLTLQFTVTPSERTAPVPPWKPNATPAPTKEQPFAVTQRGDGSSQDNSQGSPPPGGFPYTFFVELALDKKAVESPQGVRPQSNTVREPFIVKSSDPQTFTATLALPLLNQNVLRSLTIRFVGLYTSSDVAVDWIRITVPASKEAPSPPPRGCEYRQVECVRAPCDPVLICQSQGVPEPRLTPYPSLKPTSKPKDSPWCKIVSRIPGGTSLPDYAKDCLE